MQEYVGNIKVAARQTGMTAAELQALSDATYRTIMELREQLARQGKMMWLNGVDNADPFPLTYDSNCTGDYGQCGWWHAPAPGPSCVAFFRERCGDADYGSAGLGTIVRIVLLALCVSGVQSEIVEETRALILTRLTPDPEAGRETPSVIISRPCWACIAGVLRAGSWELSIATLLLLRQERGWLVTDWWQGTSATVCTAHYLRKPSRCFPIANGC
jgi:hypothetical protein